MQKFSFTAFSLNDSAKFRPYFGVQTQNLQRSAPHWQPASGLTLIPHFLTDTSYQNAHKTLISLSWAFPKHAGKWLQHEFGSDKCAVSSYAWPEKQLYCRLLLWPWSVDVVFQFKPFVWPLLLVVLVPSPLFASKQLLQWRGPWWTRWIKWFRLKMKTFPWVVIFKAAQFSDPVCPPDCTKQKQHKRRCIVGLESEENCLLEQRET